MQKVEINKSVYDRIPCGINDHLDHYQDGTPCEDCGADPGAYHTPGCKYEQCPTLNACDMAKNNKCGGQLCGCVYNPTYF